MAVMPRKVLGASLVAVPFIGIAVAVYTTAGLLATLGMFAIAGMILAVVFYGLRLLFER
jgi:hypothetical protein